MEDLLIAPSILSADFSDLRGGARTIEDSGADWVHLDVMDGRFVPNLTFGPKMVADLRPHCGLPFDVHLMTEEPEGLVEAFAKAGADWITFHIEATVHAHRLVQRIHDLGAKAGISLVPSTPVSAVEELLPFVDLALVMTVNPGFGGQALIGSCLRKIEALARLRQALGLDFLISVDGGVNRATLEAVAGAGADVLVMGSAFFGSSNPAGEVLAARAQGRSKALGN